MIRRDTLIVSILLIVITAFGFINGIRQQRQTTAAPLYYDSTNPSGANALMQWLEELEFEVSTQRVGRFEVPDDVGLVLMLEPAMPVSERELQRLEAWVAEGGTLLIAGANSSASAVASHFEFAHDFYFRANMQFVRPVSLAIQRVAGWNSAEIDPTATLFSDRHDFVTHLAVENSPVVVSFPVGDGNVVLTTLWEPFSNYGIQRKGNAELVMNLIGMHEFDGQVWFDTWHHGDRLPTFAGEIVGPGAWVRRTHLGQALLFSIALGYVALLWRGRRFGRPIPLPDTTERRPPLEYITAIANMNRRAGNRQTIINDYRLRLKRGLGVRHRIDAALPDNDYLKTLQAARPELDINAVRDLLRRLQNMNLSETELVTIATDVTDFLENN
ncbi:MAG: DUF4350 domain-containing protein [Candidatus Promineifilaceae bacterium]